MGRLNPAQRAAIWQNHIRAYEAAHPELAPGDVTLLEAAAELATPSMFGGADKGLNAEVATIGGQIKASLGADVADYLLFRLGPKDGTFASIEPISLKLAGAVRSAFVALAEAPSDCDCNLGFDGCGYAVYCKDGSGCTRDEEWPMCGWFWNEVCDGVCSAGAPHD